MVVSAAASPYQQCLRFAAAQGEILMGELVQASRSHLFKQVGAEPESPRRTSLQAALRALNQHERFLRHHFPQSLLVEFSVAANTQSKAAVPAPKMDSGSGWVSFDQLELMDDMQLQERVEVARIQELAIQSTEVELSELNRLICGAQGLEVVQADRNPMRPETYSRTLRAALLATNESLAVRLSWMQPMGEVLGTNLAITYRQLSKMLRDLGVQPAGYQVSQAVSTGRTGMFMVEGMQVVPVAQGVVRLGDLPRGAAPMVPPSALMAGAPQGPGVIEPVGRGIPVPTATVPPAVPYTTTPAPAKPRSSGDLALPPLPDLIEPPTALPTLPSELPPLPSELPSMSALPSLPALPEEEPPEVTQDKLLTLNRLRLLLTGQLDAPPAAPPAAAVSWTGHLASRSPATQPEFSETVPAAFEALEEMKQLGQVVQRLEHRQKGGTDSTAPKPGDVSLLREQFRREAKGMGQLLGLEVVQLMVDNIAHDQRLQPPVREAVLTLEPALLRLALKDPRFFSDRQHPARRLLEEITERSLGYESVQADGFNAFIQPVQTTVEALALVVVDGPEPFLHALNSLREDWERHAARQPRKEKAVQALLQAEQRAMLATQITKELRDRADLQFAPADVAQLVLGPWAQVMAQSRLNNPRGGVDPEGYGALVKDLIWSARPSLARGDRNRLVRLIPELIRRLTQGLESINYPVDRRDAFLDVLMDLHQQAFKPGEVQPSVDPEQEASAPLLRAALDARFDEANEPGPWFVGTEAKDTGFLDSESIRETSQPTAGQFQPTQLLSSRTGVVEPVVDPVDALVKPGIWLELNISGQWVRSQLTWVSPQGALLMFTTVTGEAQSMTRRSFERLVERGQARPLAEQTVVDVALDAVTQAALRNSMKVGR